MSKYKSELKLEIVKYVLEQHHSIADAVIEFNVTQSLTELWIRKYNTHGVKGLLKNNLKYDGTFKNYVLEYMHNNHLSLNETAIRFNIANHVIVGKWERIYYEEGPHALFKDARGIKKNMSSINKKNVLSNEVKEDLIEENQKLRMENAYLKKLQALVQERVKQENQKKHKP